MNEIRPTQKLLNLFKTQDGYPIERKAVDVSGRLGSLYDISTDNLIDRHSAQITERKVPRTRSICRLFPGDQSRELTSYLKDIGFDDSLRQSICLQMVLPKGISRFIEYNQPVNMNTRFLYYSYRDRKEWLEVTAHQADRLIAAPLSPTQATHMITKIIWGFEILCVIQIPKTHSISIVDNLLRYICDQLNDNQVPIQLINHDLHLVNQLTNVTVYGSEKCVYEPNISLLAILTGIEDRQRNWKLCQPLMYTMQPLKWLYNSLLFHEPCTLPDPTNPHIARIEFVINRIKNRIKDLGDRLQNLPISFSSTALDQRAKELQERYHFLLNSQNHLQEALRQTLIDIRRQRIESIQLDYIIEDQRYEFLSQTEMENFLTYVKQLLNKSKLIEDIKRDQFEYKNAADVHSDRETPTTIEEIDIILKHIYENKDDSVILWYSSDRLRREEKQQWHEIYRELAFEQQQAKQQQIKLIYVDFTYVKAKLENSLIVRLPLAEA